MINLTAEHDYVTADTDDWLADITDQNGQAAQDAYDTWREANPEPYYESDAVLAWLATLHDDRNADTAPTGLYHDGKPGFTASVNEVNWLDRDIMTCLAHTEEYGDLLVWQFGYMTSAQVHIAPFIGDDDSEAWGWCGGSASHADGSECDADWIIESACVLWANGGEETHRIYDLEESEDDGSEHALMCPRHHVPLAFVGY